MLDRFHSKLHRYNHHTNATPGILDSASDPIGNPSDPFKGNFHIQGTLSATVVEGLNSIRVGVTGGNNATITAPGLTSPRTFTHPNASGTYVLDTTVSPFVSSYFAANIGSVGFTSNTVWVDSVSGNNTSGLRARSDKPFLTLAAAQAAASANDVIVVRPGNYAEINLGKNGVDYYFQPGANLIGSALTSPFFTYSGKSYNVYGSGTFYVSGGINLIGNNALVADFGSATGDNMVFEFDRVIIDPSSSSVTTPLVAAFKGTYDNTNITLVGNTIYAPKVNVFSSIKGSTTGVQSFTVEVHGFISGQVITYDSFHKLSGYITSPIISATNYLYNDGGTVSATDTSVFEGDSVYGAILKSSTTGPLTVDAISYTTSNTAVSGLASGISYTGALTFKAQTVTLTYTTNNYTLFYSNGSNSVLKAVVDEINNTPASAYNVVYMDSVSAAVVKVNFGKLTNGGNMHLYGTNLKSRVNVDATPSTYIDVQVLSASTDSALYLEGVYKTLSASNVRYTAVSGQSGSKLYIPTDTTLQAAGTYNIDLSGVSGAPLDIYVLGGVVTTNLTPVDVATNFTLNCGTFETASALEVPTF